MRPYLNPIQIMENKKFIFLTIARNRKRKFFLNEILYCTADNTYTTVKLLDGSTFLLSTPLKSIEEMLCPASFCKISRSAILNIHYIQELNTGSNPLLTLTTGEAVQPNKSKIKQIETLLYTLQNESDGFAN